ncbi:glycosyltransferase family 4 protein [Glaciimonas sp. PAMC28666]|uniref:glycosyltransferase family 4 protein n=1 Tax=Glaciimonas sp. PAMC28666 TaxID=2807626 RepID=UPI001962843A|nr:glycosyltransferase family 4 protein [Glaciimonas sp. PAMC28666]QRX84519.1 glycosyltransferase family 4 protein [Glaciimonas sp. PAMC28666]
MRVLHFYKTSFPSSMGGVEQVIAQLARGTSKLGVQTDVLSLSANPGVSPMAMDGHSLYRAKLNIEIASSGFSASAFWQFAQLAKKADVIHFHFPWPFMDLVHFATRAHKPTVVTYHSDIIRQQKLLKIYRPLKRMFLSSVDRIVATSPSYLSSSAVLTRYADKVSVIPIGLDKTSYPAPLPALQQYWRERLGEKFFLFIGVLRQYKGLHILLAAAQGTNYPIVIVGAGPMEEELKAQVAQLGLQNVHFLGQVSEEDKVALLTMSYAVILPSHLRSEAFGISLLEGAMYGKPLLSCELGTATTFINLSNETGLVVPPNDVDALRNAMQVLWDNPEVAAEMGRRAEERYWAQFTAKQMASSYVALYTELMTEPRKVPSSAALKLRAD